MVQLIGGTIPYHHRVAVVRRIIIIDRIIMTGVVRFGRLRSDDLMLLLLLFGQMVINHILLWNVSGMPDIQ